MIYGVPAKFAPCCGQFAALNSHFGDQQLLKTACETAIVVWTRNLEETTGDAIQVEEGSLYPALYRMEKRGWIEAEWGKSKVGRKAKIYRLTTTGRKQLRLETAEWSHFASAVSRVLMPSS